jgi:hypothetical protein
MTCRQRDELLSPSAEERIRGDDDGAGVQLHEGGEGGVELAFGARLQDMELQPLAFPVSSTSRTTRSAFALRGFTSRAITPAWGASSARSASRLGINSIAMMLTPVRLPPGRAKLATRPSSTGSPPVSKTIGIVEVAFLAGMNDGWECPYAACVRRYPLLGPARFRAGGGASQKTPFLAVIFSLIIVAHRRETEACVSS